MQSATRELLNASDKHCVEFVKNWPADTRKELWSSRYLNSPALLQEFASEADYVAYMEARVRRV